MITAAAQVAPDVALVTFRARTAPQSAQWICGRLRDFQALFWRLVLPALKHFPSRGHKPLTQTVNPTPGFYRSNRILHACPCGYYGDPIKPCTCAPAAVTKYQKRISGPLLDRIDIHVEVPRVDYQKLSDDRLGEPSSAIRARVEAARDIQRHRFSDGQTSKDEGRV